MKRLLITAALVAAVTSALAQGTVQFSNGTLSRLSLITPGVSTVQIPTTANYNFGLFFGIGSSSSLQLSPTLGMNSTASLGIIANAATRNTALSIYPLAGTIPNQADVWIQIKGWDSSFGSDWLAASTAGGTYFGESSIRNVGLLGPTAGPGLNIWQGATGTAVSQIPAFALTQVAVIPEPTSMALAGLGLASLLIFRRRK